MPVQPVTRRHLVGQIRRRLDSGIAPVVGVRGPRQIGKTTAQFQIIQDLLDEGVDARRILRVQFDDLQSLGKLSEPILRISDWFERRITPKRFNTLAHSGEPVYLFFDEIQNLKRWDVQLKSLVDNASVKVVVTGSSALRIELGRDSLAGRINTIEAGVLSLTEIGALREEVTLKGERGRKRDENLLEELFGACRYAGQTPRTSTLAEEARLSLGANIGTQRVTHYLKFLGDALLLRLIPPLEIRLKRRRGSPKLCLVDHGLRASWLQESIPLVPRFGAASRSHPAGGSSGGEHLRIGCIDHPRPGHLPLSPERHGPGSRLRADSRQCADPGGSQVPETYRSPARHAGLALVSGEVGEQRALRSSCHSACPCRRS